MADTPTIVSDTSSTPSSNPVNSSGGLSNGNNNNNNISNNNTHKPNGQPTPLTNALLVSSPNKLVVPPRQSDWDPWRLESQKKQLTSSLWQALLDPDLNDVQLVANDGDQIPASRFVLAARSPVLKRMLYGSFREAKSSTICMMGYESTVLKAVVHYCQTNQMPPIEHQHHHHQQGQHSEEAPTTSRNSIVMKSNSSHTHGVDLESLVRQQVRLYQAADFLELNDLGNLVYFELRRLTGLYPGLACVVFDEVDDVSSRVGEYARLMMEVRPYVSLGAGTRLIANPAATNNEGTTTAPEITSSSSMSTNSTKYETEEDDTSSHEAIGGVECLRVERLQMIIKSDNLMCGELFLFQILRQWYDHKVTYLGDDVDESMDYEKEASSLLEATSDCARCLHMENIEPAALLQIVQPCPFIHPTFLYDAFAKQALRASQHRVWSLHSRPTKYQMVERVLVEDCGSRQVSGMYVRMVHGLKKTHAVLYTKREVVSGQAMVYTLSCSVVAQPTHEQQQRLVEQHQQQQDSQVPPPQEMVECRIFCSPLLTPHAIPTLFQYHANSAYVDPLFQPILQIVAVKLNSSKRNRTVVVSDGHYCMQGTLANNLAIHNSKEIQLYGILQVLAFRLDQSSSSPSLMSSNSSTSDRSHSSNSSNNSSHAGGGGGGNSSSNNNNTNNGQPRRRKGTMPRIHIQRVSIVNSNAGQVFGRPTFFRGPPKQELSPQKDIHSIAEESSNDNQHPHLHPHHVPAMVDIDDPHHHHLESAGSGDDASTFAGHHQAVVKDLKHVTVLYSCSYPLKKTKQTNHPFASHAATPPKEARVPRLGWQVEEAGIHPPPTCTWFPAMPTNAVTNPSVMAAMRGLLNGSGAAATTSSSSTMMNLDPTSSSTAIGGTRSAASTPSRSSVLSKSSTTTAESLLSLSTVHTAGPQHLTSILQYEDGGDNEEEQDVLQSQQQEGSMSNRRPRHPSDDEEEEEQEEELSSTLSGL